MENKSNSLNRIKRQQREKVLRYSIRKYSFGAASVAVAALMFLGARVASADSVLPNAPQSNTANGGVVNPKDKVDSPVDVAESTDNKVDTENQALTTAAPSASTVDKAKLKKVVEELNALLSTKLNLDESVVSPVKERLQKGKEALESSELAQKDIDELVELLSKDVTVVSAAKEVTEVQVDKKVEAQVDNTEKPAANLANQSSPEVSASEESQTVSAKKDTLKVSVEQLQAAVLEVPEHETSKEVLEKANELLGLAQVVLENTTVSLNDVEDMTKRVKRMFNSVKNATTRLTSGARDSRNGKSMAQGTNFRANGEINQGALTNVKYFASVDPRENGGRRTINDNPEFTRNKTDIKATYVQDSEGKWIVYDVFFNNDGKKMTESSYQQQYYFQAPFNIMDPSNTVRDLRFTRYSPKNPNAGKKLSDGFEAFNQYGNTAYISNPWGQQYKIFNNDGYSFYDPSSGVTRNDQRKDVFKNNENDPTLNTLTKDKNGNYPKLSYYLGVKLGRESTNYAVHMHAKIKIRDNVTPQEAAQYGRVYAASTTSGWTTNQSYIMGATGSRLQNDPEAPKDPIKGLTVTKTVGDYAGDPINPVSSGYVTHKNGKSFPAGMNWTWAGDRSPSTAQAGVFKYTSIATYKDGTKSTDAGSGSDGTVTLIVKPKQPTITTSVANKKGETNQQITVNVGSGVPNGSTVKLYDGNTVIGTGTTNGETATVTVTGALPGNPITAETVVNNGGTVTSARSNPVTPTPKPDTQDPTLTVTPLEQTVKVGEKIKFNVDGRDDTKVNLDFSDIFTKYPNHLFTQKTNYSVNTDKQKTLSIDLGEAKESDIGEKTVTVKATDDAGHKIEKTVKVKVIPATKENEKHNPTAETLEIGIKQELTDEAIKAKVKNYPSNATLTVKQKPDTDTTGNKTATVIVTYSDKSTDEVTVPVVVRDTTPPKIYWVKDDGSKVELGKTHAEGQNIVIPLYRGDAVNTRLITTDDSGKVTNFKTENLQSGFNFTPVSGTATEGSPLGQNVTGTVGLGVAKGKYTARAISTDGTNTTTGYFVFEVHEQAEKYTPAANTLTVPFNHKITDDEVKGKVIAKPGTPAFPTGTIFEVVSKPETNTTGTDKKAVVKITYPDKSTENIDVPVHVGKDLASQHPLEGQTVTVTVGDSLKTWKGRVDSNQYTNAPKGRGNGVEWGWKGTTPKALQDTAGVFKYTATATHPDKSVAESNPQVTVIVKPKAPTIETDLTGKAELPNTSVVVNVHNGVKDGSIVTLYSQDGRAIGTGTVTNGKATITGTIPKGNITAKTTVQTPGQDDVVSEPSPIKEATNIAPTAKTQTVGLNEKPNAKNSIGNNVDLPNGTNYTWKTTPDTSTPGDKPGVVTVTYPDGSTIDVPVTVKVTQVSDDYTPKYEDGSGKPGSKVEIPLKEENGKDIPAKTTYVSDQPGVIDVDDKGKVTVTIPKDKNPGDKVTGKITVTYPDGSTEEVPVNVTVTNRDKDDYTPKYEDGSGKPGSKVEIPLKEENGKDIPAKTTYVSDQPGVIDVDDKGKVTVTIPKDKNPGDKVTGKITVTYPDGSTEEVPVNVTVTNRDKDDYTPKYEDGSGKPGSKVEIPLKEENGKDIPAKTTYVSDQPGVIDVDDKGKVTVTIPKDKNPGDKVTGKITVTYPDGSTEEVPVTVTVTNRDKDVYTPKYEDGSGKPGSKVEIPLKEENGKDIPAKTTYVSDQPGVIDVDDKGKVTVTIPKDKNPGDKITGKITVTYPDGSTEEVPVNVTVTNRDKDDYTPKYEDGSGKPGSKVEIPLKEENGKDIPAKTTYVSDQPGVIDVDDKGKVTVTIPKDKNPGDKITGKITVTYPDGSKDEVPVSVTVTNQDTEKPGKIEITRKPNGNAIVTPKKPDGSTYPSGSKVVIPGENNTPIEVTIGDNGSGEVPNDKLPKKDVPGTGTVTEPNKKPSQPVDVTTPAQKTPTLDVEQDPKTGDVTVTPKKPDGSTFPPGTKVEIPGKDGNPITVTIGEDGKGKVPNSELPDGKVPGTAKITEPGKPAVEVPVETPAKVTPETPTTEKPSEIEITRKPNGDAVVTPKKPDGSTYPSGSKVVIPGENNTPIEVTIGDNGSGEVPNDKLPKKDVPGTGTVTEPNKKPSQPVDVTTPAQKTPTLDVEQDPKTGDVTVTPKKPDGSTFPPGTKVEIPGKDGNPITVTIGEDGKGKVPNSELPDGKVPGTAKITEPGKPAVEVPVETPAKVTPETPTTEKPSEIEITRKPNGDAVVTPKKPDGSTYPSGSKVVIPGENNTPIEVTIGDNGSGEVPNDKLPKKDVPGTGTVTEPNKKPSQPVDVTTPAQKTPTLDVEQDPKTGDVTVTPKKPDGSTFPPGTKVEIPGKDGNPITVTIGEDGKGKVPNSELPDGKVPGTAKITEPGKPAVEVPVETPAKVTPETPTTEKPSEIEITRKPNGDAVVTPKKPDGSTYPSGSKVVIPGENNTPIEVTIGDNGSGEVPNDKLPKKDVPGTGTVTEPNKKPSQPVDVTTPAQKTPTLDVEQDPKTGDVTVTPKKPDGSTFPPGTKVEIPGKDGNPITVTIGEDGKGKVPNSELPDGKVPGTAKITEPGKPAVEVPVETPAKVTPETPTTEKPSEIEITRKPNGDAVVTPKKPDGSTYPSGSKVVIPGENNTPIEVTIGDNGSGEVPNDKLPKKDVPGTGTVTEPNKKPSQPVDVTTPAQKTPTLDVEQDPKTGDVTVTPKKPDGSTFPPGTKVEIPGKDGNPITVTIGEDGKGKVPNSELPDGKVPGTAKITEPGKPAVEVPVETPAKVTPETPTTEKPSEIEITRKPNGDAVVTPKKPDGSTYPSGSKVVIPGENNTPIEVTIGDNGSGEVPNDKLPKKDVPGTGTVTEPNKKPSQPVDVTTPAQKTPTLDVEQDPKTGDVTVTPKKPDGSTFPPGTKVEIPGKDGNPITVTIGEDGKGKVPNSELPDGKVPGTAKITEPGKPAVEVPVETPAKVTPETPTTEKPSEIEITRKPNGDAVVTPKKPDGSTYPSGSKVVIPGENNTPIEVTIGDNGSGEVPNDKLPKKDVPGTGTVTEPNKKPSQPVDVTTPAQKTPTLDVEQDPKTGDVTVTPKKPDGSTFPPGTKVEIPGKDGNPITVTIGEDGKGKVPNSELPDGKVPGTAKITEPGKPAVEVPVETPAKVTPETPTTEKPSEIEITRKPNGDAVVTPKKPDGSTYPSGSKVVIPGENNTPIEVTIGDNGSGEVPNDKLPKKDVPGTGTVTEPNKKPSQPVDVTTPAQKTPTLDVEQDPKTGDVTVTPKKPDGSTFPPGTKVEIPGKDGNPITVTIGEDGKGKVPNSELPDGKVPGTAKITEPGKPAVEVPVETPAKVTPETPTTEKPSEIEITRKPNGDAVVTPKKPDGSTYPSGSKVVIPGENNTPIEVTIGDNGSGEVPNDKLPKKDVPGTGTVTEPNKKPSQPVDVTTPAQKTPTLDVEQDPKTGDVTVTPKKPDGSTFPPGTKVEIPGKDGNPITVTIGEDGKGKVPNSELPDGKVPGTAKITEPGKPAVEVPVETPAKVTPETPTTEKPSEIEITRKPNGDAVVTPKKPDGSTYPSGSKVVIPGENNTPIEVTIGDNGSGEVPNDKLPKKDVPGTGTVTEPNKKPSQPVDVTTPAQKTPTLDVEQDPKTGDVTVTPKKPDGSTFPPGTKVEIPGKDGNPITVTIGEDGKGKVPNSELPDGKVPGTAKITEPGKPAVEVPVETPAKVTPETLTPNADQVDTKTTNDNGAKSNDSQNVLPNTGTESNAALASLGLLGLLSGFGLVARKKKED